MCISQAQPASFTDFRAAELEAVSRAVFGGKEHMALRWLAETHLDDLARMRFRGNIEAARSWLQPTRQFVITTGLSSDGPSDKTVPQSKSIHSESRKKDPLPVIDHHKRIEGLSLILFSGNEKATLAWLRNEDPICTRLANLLFDGDVDTAAAWLVPLREYARGRVRQDSGTARCRSCNCSASQINRGTACSSARSNASSARGDVNASTVSHEKRQVSGIHFEVPISDHESTSTLVDGFVVLSASDDNEPTPSSEEENIPFDEGGLLVPRKMKYQTTGGLSPRSSSSKHSALTTAMMTSPSPDSDIMLPRAFGTSRRSARHLHTTSTPASRTQSRDTHQDNRARSRSPFRTEG